MPEALSPGSYTQPAVSKWSFHCNQGHISSVWSFWPHVANFSLEQDASVSSQTKPDSPGQLTLMSSRTVSHWGRMMEWQQGSVGLGVSSGSSEQLDPLPKSGIDSPGLGQAARPQKGTETLLPTPGFSCSAPLMSGGGSSFMAGAVLGVLGHRAAPQPLPVKCQE